MRLCSESNGPACVLLLSRSLARRQHFALPGTLYSTDVEISSAIGGKWTYGRYRCHNLGTHGYEDGDDKRRCP